MNVYAMKGSTHQSDFAHLAELCVPSEVVSMSYQTHAQQVMICDTIKGNESSIFNFKILTPLAGNFEMLYVYANSVRIGYLITEL